MRQTVPTLILAAVVLLLADSVSGRLGSNRRRKLITAPKGAHILGEYVVVMSPQSSEDISAMSTMTNIAMGDGATVKNTYHAVVNGFTVSNVSANALEEYLDSPDVAYVEQNQWMYAQGFQFSSKVEPLAWGLDRIDQRRYPLDEAYEYTGYGRDVDVYIIDTGILLDHEEFGGRAFCAVDMVEEGSEPCNDESGHGTHVAGIVGGHTYGVAKYANLHAVKVLDRQGKGRLSAVLDGLEHVARSREDGSVSVVNLSLGGSYSPSLNNAVDKIVQESNMVMVVAAGNSNRDACEMSPSSADNVVSVGAVQKNSDERSWYSNYGDCVSVWAPGDSIPAASKADPHSIVELSGTSMASPHVAGVAALYVEGNPFSTAKEIEQHMLADALLDKVEDTHSVNGNNRLITTIRIANKGPSCRRATDFCVADADCCNSLTCNTYTNECEPAFTYETERYNPFYDDDDDDDVIVDDNLV